MGTSSAPSNSFLLLYIIFLNIILQILIPNNILQKLVEVASRYHVVCLVDESWTSARSHVTGGGYENPILPGVGPPPFNIPVYLPRGSCNHRYVIYCFVVAVKLNPFFSRKRTLKEPDPAGVFSTQWRKWCIDNNKVPICPARLCGDYLASIAMRPCYRLVQCLLIPGVVSSNKI